MEKLQHIWAPPGVKCNCIALFLCQLYLLFIYASKYFPIDHHHCKTQTELFELPAGCIGTYEANTHSISNISESPYWAFSMVCLSLKISQHRDKYVLYLYQIMRKKRETNSSDVALDCYLYRTKTTNIIEPAILHSKEIKE